MTPVLTTLPALFGLTMLCTVTGFGFGVLAMWRPGPEDPAPPYLMPGLPHVDPGTPFEFQGCWGPLSWGQLEREVIVQTVPVAAVSARRGPGRRAASA